MSQIGDVGKNFRKLILRAESNTRGLTKWPIQMQTDSMEDYQGFTDGVFYVPSKQELTLENIIVPPYYNFAKEGKLVLTVINGGQESTLEYNFNKKGAESIPSLKLKEGYALSAFLEFSKELADSNFGPSHEAKIHLLFNYKEL